jgi:hypothetical protein
MTVISAEMVKHYLGCITVGYFDDHDLHPDDVTGYRACVAHLQAAAEHHGDLAPLRLALEHMLGTPGFDFAPYAGDRYPYDPEDVREIVQYVWETLWPDAAEIPPGGPTGVTLVKMSLEAWWAR